MKEFRTLKLCIAVLGFGAALIFVPSSRAQSEVAPDHFDLNETVQAQLPKTRQSSPAAVSSARTRAASSHATAHLAAPGASSVSRQPEVLAVEDKRKTSVAKSN